jgi:uncharacterized protein YggU (UPF0235/DUF167 family)
LAPKKLIRIDFPTNRDGSLTHQIRNLGEDLYREIEVPGVADLGGLEAVDTATDRLEVRIHRTSLVGRTRAQVQEIIARHLLADRAVVTFAE